MFKRLWFAYSLERVSLDGFQEFVDALYFGFAVFLPVQIIVPSYIAICAFIVRLTAGKARLRTISGQDLQANPCIAVQPTIG